MLNNSTFKLRRLKNINTIVAAFIFLHSCNHFIGNNLQNQGSPYPSSYTDNDSNDFFFPLRSKLSKRDSLSYSYQYWLYHAFQEPNLSLRYIGTPHFRISYYEE